MPRDDFWDDEDDPLFKIMRDMMKRMERIFREMDLFDEDMFRGKPMIRGFSVTIGPDGVPRVREFGPGIHTEEPRMEEGEEIQPDIIEQEDGYLIVIDLPGIDENTLRLRLEGDRLLVKAEGKRKILKYIQLPEKIRGEIENYEYNNGVLTINIRKKKGLRLL